MKKMMSILLTMILSSTFAYAADEDNNQGLVGAMKVSTVSIDEQGSEVFTKTTEVIPGELLEYEIVYTNSSDHVFNDVSVTGRVPTGTIFIKDSASNDISQPMFTIDNNLTWSEKPMIQEIVNGVIVDKEAPVSSYNGVKWNVDFEQKEEKTFKYRVRIEE